MKKNRRISIAMTVVTTMIFGLLYPMIVTGLAQVIYPHKANGQLIVKDGKIIGSSIVGGDSPTEIFPLTSIGRWRWV